LVDCISNLFEFKFIHYPFYWGTNGVSFINNFAIAPIFEKKLSGVDWFKKVVWFHDAAKNR
jgi:hypothetical protein